MRPNAIDHYNACKQFVAPRAMSANAIEYSLTLALCIQSTGEVGVNYKSKTIESLISKRRWDFHSKSREDIWILLSFDEFHCDQLNWSNNSANALFAIFQYSHCVWMKRVCYLPLLISTHTGARFEWIIFNWPHRGGAKTMNFNCCVV